MNSFNQLMAGFGVVTVMNARIYKLAEGSSYKKKGLTPFDFDDTGLYLDTLKLANITQEGPTKVITGGQYNTPLLKYGKKTTLEMQNALGSAEVLERFFGCDYDREAGIISVTDKFPSAFAIEGETFFINQKTGAKEKVWIFIPQFLPDAILNLTQDAKGDVASFDCNGTVCVTNIADPKYPQGHGIFYHIASQPWLRFGYTINSNIAYTMKPDGTLLVTGLADEKYTGDVIIPSLHIVDKTPKTVTEIAPNAFAANKGYEITNVYIPNAVTRIGASAFENQTKLKRVVINAASNLRYIGDRAFYGTRSVIPFNIPEKVWWVSTDAFGTYTKTFDGSKIVVESNDSVSNMLHYQITSHVSQHDNETTLHWFAAYADDFLLDVQPNAYYSGVPQWVEYPNFINHIMCDMPQENPAGCKNVQGNPYEDTGFAGIQVQPIDITCNWEIDSGTEGQSESRQEDRQTSAHIVGTVFYGVRASSFAADVVQQGFNRFVDIYIPDDITCIHQLLCGFEHGSIATPDVNQVIWHIPDNCFSFNAQAFIESPSLINTWNIEHKVILPWDEKEAILRGYPWGADTTKIYFKFK